MPLTWHAGEYRFWVLTDILNAVDQHLGEQLVERVVRNTFVDYPEGIWLAALQHTGYEFGEEPAQA